MNKSLLIMAAGMGSRYGGNKQTDGLGPRGEMLMEYTISDAKKAGFTKAVFVIAPSMLEFFPKMISERIKGIELCFAVQDYSSLPEGFNPPAQRTRPYGTVHAVLCAGQHINEPFAVVNADDYYGSSAIADLGAQLDALPAEGYACMVAYPLANTLSGHAGVTRGICRVEGGLLTGITETYGVVKGDCGEITGVAGGNQVVLPGDSPASMNMFGFMPWIFRECGTGLAQYLAQTDSGDMKAELPLPVLLDKLISSDKLKLRVSSTDSQWFGVTFREDREAVAEKLRAIGPID